MRAHSPTRSAATFYFSLHIPKTAGTTLGMALAWRFGSRLQYAYEKSAQSRSSARNPHDGCDSEPSCCQTPELQCLHGHDILSECAEIIGHHADAKWIVFLRNPLELAISLYFHAKRTPSLSQFVDRGLIHWLTATDEYRWPDPPCYPHNQFQRQWASEYDRQFADFDFVGITEQFDESILLMARHFDWEPPLYEIRNSGGYVAPTLSPEVVTRFRELNAIDEAIYRASVARLNALKRAYGRRFASDLATFRARLRARYATGPGPA